MQSVSISIAIQSHLADASMEIDFNPELAKKRITFVKTLIHKFGKNIKEEITNDELNKIWETIK